jgi:regulator of sigma E protease
LIGNGKMEWLSTALGWIWGNVLVFVAVLTIVVFIHELGHFLVARWCGVTVKAFSIGFGPEIFGFNDKHGTRWRFAWIPLGGYVKFMDDENAASKPSADAIRNMTPEEREGSFHAKPVWQRAAVVAAGPIANFILAIAIFAGLNLAIGVRDRQPVIDALAAASPAERAGLMQGDIIKSIDGRSIETFEDAERQVGENSGAAPMSIAVERDGKLLTFEITPSSKSLSDELGGVIRIGDIGIESRNAPVVGGVSDGAPAAKAGFKPGDVIRSINGQDIKWFEDLVAIVSASKGQSLSIVVQRDGNLELPMTVAPMEIEEKNQAGVASRRWIIGVSRIPPDPRPVGLIESIRLGTKDTWTVIRSTFTGLSQIGSNHDQIGGPIMMAQVTAKVAEQGLEWLARLVALFSANIGFLNLLPIPVLDGGHLLFYGIEAVWRRPLSERVQSFGFQIGLALILMLMFLATFNDLAKLWSRLAGAS